MTAPHMSLIHAARGGSSRGVMSVRVLLQALRTAMITVPSCTVFDTSRVPGGMGRVIQKASLPTRGCVCTTAWNQYEHQAEIVMSPSGCTSLRALCLSTKLVLQRHLAALANRDEGADSTALSVLHPRTEQIVRSDLRGAFL